MLCSLFIWPLGDMQPAYVFSTLLSTGNSLPLDCENFSEYNLLFSRCTKGQLFHNTKYTDLGFVFCCCCWSSWISFMREKFFECPWLYSERDKVSSLIQTSEWLLSFFFSKHLILKGEISPYDLKFFHTRYT